MDTKYCSKCGGAVINDSNFCSNCGKRFTKKADLPNRDMNYGAHAKKLIFLASICIFVLAIIFKMDDNKKTSVFSEAKRPAPKLIDFSPQRQKEFTNMINKYKSQYQSALNELQKTDLRKKRDTDISLFTARDLSVSKWVGTISGIGTETDGKAYFTMLLTQSNIAVKTFNNSSSDSKYKTMVLPSSPLYNSIFNLKNGDEVVFSGNFVRDEQAGILEISLTEVGKMKQPEFLMIFSSIEKTKVK